MIEILSAQVCRRPPNNVLLSAMSVCPDFSRGSHLDTAKNHRGPICPRNRPSEVNSSAKSPLVARKKNRDSVRPADLIFREERKRLVVPVFSASDEVLVLLKGHPDPISLPGAFIREGLSGLLRNSGASYITSITWSVDQQGQAVTEFQRVCVSPRSPILICT